MKHPNREQLVAFFYEDCERAEKSELAQHLDACAACRHQLQTLRATASMLNEYVVPTPSMWTKTVVRLRTWIPLAAAASVMLAVGVAVGSRANPAQTQVIAELRERVEKSEAENAKTKKLLVDLGASIAENRAKDQATLVAVAQELQATRKDVETMAVLTEAGFKTTQNRLVQLAGYTPQQQ